MTIMEQIRAGNIPETVRLAAERETVDPAQLAETIAAGRAVVPANRQHPPASPRAIGEGLSVKVNVNIGTSQDHDDIQEELDKLAMAVKLGADAVMDLSTGSGTRATRQALLQASPLPLGTVPLYEAFLRAGKDRGSIKSLSVDDILSSIEEHGRDGVDFVTLHCGLTREAWERLRNQGRVTDVVSRGGSLLVEWMVLNDQENPLYEHYDQVIDICHRHDMTISLGDGLRPGCIADATDRAQIQELLVLGELAQRAQAQGVQVMIEGPGHVPLDQIAANIQLEKRLCNGAPFYVLGPLVTDIAPGYDHITGAIGGALAAMHGADFLCYLTPAEHLRLPNQDDVRRGLIASRIAAHAADIVRGIPGAADRDLRMSRARKQMDWEGMFREALDPDLARSMRDQLPSGEKEACSMCSQFCAMKTINQVMQNGK